MAHTKPTSSRATAVTAFYQSSKTARQPLLGSLSDGPNAGSHSLSARVNPLRGARPKAVIPGGFHQHPARMAVARAGDSSLPPSAATGVFAGDQTEIGHQLFGSAERLKSPISAASTTAVTNSTPRSACSARTNAPMSL